MYGTAVFRDAENSNEIIEEIKQKFDIDLRIITGEEEGQSLVLEFFLILK